MKIVERLFGLGEYLKTKLPPALLGLVFAVWFIGGIATAYVVTKIEPKDDAVRTILSLVVAAALFTWMFAFEGAFPRKPRQPTSR